MEVKQRIKILLLKLSYDTGRHRIKTTISYKLVTKSCVTYFLTLVVYYEDDN